MHLFFRFRRYKLSRSLHVCLLVNLHLQYEPCVCSSIFFVCYLSLIEAADALLIIMPHPTGLLPISQPRRVLLAPFPGTDLIRQCKRRVLEAIYNRIRSSHMPALPSSQMDETGKLRKRDTRTAGLMGRYGVTLLYIKQLYTHPRVSCCQPPKSLHKLPVN